MIFSLPNGLQGYYLATNKGERLDRAPTSIVAFRQRPIGKGIDIINGRSCFDCHADGIIAKRDQLRSYIEQSPNFSMTQRQVLLETYVAQAELAQSYKQDQAKFAHALAQIDATEKAPDGSLKSMTGPGKSEIITWYADLYDDDLDAEALAAEFDMTPTEFNQAIQSVQDTQVLKIGLDWITQLKGGSKIPRFEVEEQFPKLAKAILGVDPLETKTEQSASTNESDSGGTKTAKADPSTPDYKDADYRDDAFKDDPSKATKLTLSVDVKKTNVLVDERLAFHVTANHACELQIFYVEADGNVEVIPQSMIGDKFLDAGKPRLIPAEDSGELVFDTPAANETLLLFCREGGLGNQRLSAADARKLVKKSGQPAARGLAIQLYEQNKAEAKKDTKLKGASAINMVTFNIKEKS